MIAKKESVGIITMAKYEHDFINPWIEYHSNIGFNHFYILVDNINYKQLDYIIDSKYINNVSLIYVDNDDLNKYFTKDIINSELHKGCYLHELVNCKIIYESNNYKVIDCNKNNQF